LERGLYSSTSKISQSNFFGLTILPNVLVRTGEQCGKREKDQESD
jgi:hypothetical protein